MKKILSLSILFPWLALAQVAPAAPVIAEPSSWDDLAKLIPTILDAFKQSQWLALGAAITLVLVFVFRQYLLPKLNLTTNALPLISAILGIIVGPAVAIVGGAKAGAAMMAVLSGPLASTLWQAVMKYFLPEAPPVTQPK